MNCTPPAVDDFPADGLDADSRIRGWIIFHMLAALYVIGSLAIVCDDYFVPVMHEFSERLHVPSDIAGATFMAFGTTCPELFVSMIGVFITEGDIGVGAVLGSAIFNVLVIVSVCGIFAGSVVGLNWRPLARDSASYLIAVTTLLFVIEDEKIEWYEAVLLVAEYCVYITVLYLNTRFIKYCRGPIESYDLSSVENKIDKQLQVDRYIPTISLTVPSDDRKSESKINGNVYKVNEENLQDHTLILFSPIANNGVNNNFNGEKKNSISQENDKKCFAPIYSLPDTGKLGQVTWVLWWPVKFLLYVTIPSPSSDQTFYLSIITFVASVCYIGCFSYLATWMVSIIGYTIHVPDSVMGLTFMALGNCLPEFISSIIVARQSLGNMALSNAMGGNLFALLVCLGAPWLLKTGISKISFVQIHSEGLSYSVLSLLIAVVLMFVIIAINKFKLDKKIGFACLSLYVIYVTISCMYEMNVFTLVNLPMCSSKFSL